MAESYKTNCDKCGSSDGRAVYPDTGQEHCYVCDDHTFPDAPTDPAPVAKDDPKFLKGESRALPARKITEETCKKFGYQIAQGKDGPVHVANYRRGTKLVGQKIRGKDKAFSTIGKPADAGFFGQHLFRDGGRMLVVVEGEIDALSAYQALGHRWPVVSLPQGAQSASKIFKQEIEWLERFEKVVLCFDEDDAGREAVRQVAPLLEPGKVGIASLPEKDANECLLQNKGAALVSAIWDATPYRPDGVLDASTLWDAVIADEEAGGHPYPFLGLQEMTLGCRLGEMVLLCSGSGMGKTSLTRELIYSMVQSGKKVGGLFLEESVSRTLKGLCALHLNVPHNQLSDVSEDDLRGAFEYVTGTGLMLYDHFGSSDIDTIIDRVKFMASAGCEYIYLDHLSMVISGIQTTDERKLLDVLLTRLRTLCSRFNIGLICVSHLKKPDGTAFENGAQISLSHLRGSSSLANLSDQCLALERDQQADDPSDRNKTRIRVLKNRYVGQTGIATTLNYNPQTGRLSEDEGPSLILTHEPISSAHTSTEF